MMHCSTRIRRIVVVLLLLVTVLPGLTSPNSALAAPWSKTVKLYVGGDLVAEATCRITWTAVSGGWQDTISCKATDRKSDSQSVGVILNVARTGSSSWNTQIHPGDCVVSNGVGNSRSCSIVRTNNSSWRNYRVQMQVFRINNSDDPYNTTARTTSSWDGAPGQR